MAPKAPRKDGSNRSHDNTVTFYVADSGLWVAAICNQTSQYYEQDQRAGSYLERLESDQDRPKALTFPLRKPLQAVKT